jgi:hypothetical protein
MRVFELFEGDKYKCTCLPNDKDPDCPKHGLEPMDVGDALDVKNEAKQRLDPKCWTGYKKQGTKMKGGVRVNNCVPVEEAEIPSVYSKQVPSGMEHRARYKCPSCGIANKVQDWAANDNECPTCLEPLPHGLNQMPLKYQAEAVNLDRSKNPNYPNDAATQKHRLDTAKRLLSDPKTDDASRKEAAAIIARMEPKGKK